MAPPKTGIGIGDIVAYQGTRWVVLSVEPEYHTCALSDLAGKRISVLCRPGALPFELVHKPKTWPFISVPPRPKGGHVVNVFLGERRLEPLEDWAPSGIFSSGGVLFINPGIALALGEVLVVEYAKGLKSRVAITRSFGNIEHKKKRAEGPWKPPAPKTIYDRLKNGGI
jgi:hypothetical protein